MMKKTKVLAYYLPAFHRIRENDEWYGENFTEWDNNRRAKKLFKGHNQPRVPETYYDLSDIEVTKEQMKLAKENGVDGFVYYHYWFNPSGRKVLEKPAENMLKQLKDDEKIEYCFCWANQEWRKTWHEGRGDSSELLIEQVYGTDEDWNNHFNYLLPFFKDKKYIKVNNCPVLVILRAEAIPNYNQMIAHFNGLALESGFSGLHIIRVKYSPKLDNLDIKCSGIVDFEPNYTMNSSYKLVFKHFWRLKTFLFWHLSKWEWYPRLVKNTIDYDAFYRTMKEKPRNEKYPYYYGIFVDWDNSPRKGKRGTIFVNQTPEKFKREFDYFYKKSLEEENDFLFLFAWNEWGEGAYLEADKKYGLGNINAIRDVRKKYNNEEKPGKEHNI